MRIFFATLALLTVCAMPSTAEIRILNYTGEGLKVDVMHANGLTVDALIPKEVGVSGSIGPVTPRGTQETLIVKNQHGKELMQQTVGSQSIIILTKPRGQILMESVGSYLGSARRSNVKILNATRHTVHYAYETPDRQLRKGKIDNDYPALRVWDIGPSIGYRAGQEIKVKFAVTKSPPMRPERFRPVRCTWPPIRTAS